VQAVVVEASEVLDDRELELGAGAPDAIGDELGLEGVDEALGHRVVVGVADRADGLQHVVIVEDLGEVQACILLGLNRSSQRGEDAWAPGSGMASTARTQTANAASSSHQMRWVGAGPY
jgi:hypothetical protein